MVTNYVLDKTADYSNAIRAEPGRDRLRALTYRIICLILLLEFALRLGLLLQILTCLHSPSWVIVWPLGQLSGIVTKADRSAISNNANLWRSKSPQAFFFSLCRACFSGSVGLASESIKSRSLISSSSIQQDSVTSCSFSDVISVLMEASWNLFDSINVWFPEQLRDLKHDPDLERRYPSSLQSDGMHIEP